MVRKTGLCLVAAALATLQCYASASSANPRLRETDLDMNLMGHQLPVDPDGRDGPKRVAGYFALNRTEVRDQSLVNNNIVKQG